MKPLRKSVLTPALAVLAIASNSIPSAASAQFGSGVVVCTNCSNIATQALEYAAMGEQLMTQAQQYATQLQQYQNMITNTAKLPDAVFGDAIADIRKITNTIKAAKSLAFTASDLEEKFKALGSLSSYTQSGMSAEGLKAKYEQWSEDTNDSVLSTLKALGAEAETIEDEADLMAELQERASSAEGQMQAIAVGNELAVQTVAQMQKLRTLQMLQIQMLAKDLAQRQNKEDAALARALETYVRFDKPYAGQSY